MNLAPCPACSRHVKSSDPVCPFCGAPSAPSRPAPPRATQRVSRARWLAFGPAVAVLVGCGGTVSTSPSPEQRAASDAGGTTQGVAGDTPPPGAVCSFRGGFFDCGGILCDRSIEACYRNASGGTGSCVWYGALDPSCGSCPTCACLGSDTASGETCSQDFEGSMTVVTSQHGCYGAPPARLERIA